MHLVETILGTVSEGRFSDRTVDRLIVSSGDASKRRLRCRTESGADVAIDLPRGSYLADGAVVLDDGEHIVVVEREPEDALIVCLGVGLIRAELLRQAVGLGHAFGNQHVPLEIVADEIWIPITTSREIAESTVRSLALEGAEISFGRRPLGRTRPLAAGAHENHG